MTSELPNGCNGERLAEGDHAVALADRAAGEDQFGADTAGVHEGQHRLTDVGVGSRGKLRVGDGVAERLLQRGVVGPHDVGGDVADGPVGDGCDDFEVMRDQVGEPGIRSTSRVTIRLLIVIRPAHVTGAASTRMSMSVTSRPNEKALVTGLPSITQL